MIYFFYGENDFELKNEITLWKDRFISKYGDFNFFHIKDIGSYEEGQLKDVLSSMSFMAEKKLVVIDEYPSADNKDFDEFFTLELKNIPDDTIVLFNSVKPDKRSKVYKLLLKEADKVQEFKIKEGAELISYLSSKYEGKITPSALNLLARYKSSNMLKISNEIEKLGILYDVIDDKAVKDNVLEELEESIFDFIGTITSNNPKEAVKKMRIILEQTNIYAFYSAFVTNLTNTYFIEMYKSMRLPKQEIITALDLGKKGFLVDKRHSLSFKKLEALYLDLLEVDKKMKTGETLDYGDKYIEFEIEKALLKM